jgi:transcription initiation factor TFIIE subunit alpha
MAKKQKTTKIVKKSMKKIVKPIKLIKSKTNLVKKTVKSKLMKKTVESIESKAPRKEVVTKKEVEDTIFTLSGEVGVKVIDFLGDKKNISEFVIADKLKVDMQTIRNTLYKLHTFNVATYIRKKDRQKGWYISYWTFNKPRIKEMMSNMQKMHIEKLRERLAKEESSKGVFYICPKACARLDFDQATEFEYKCPECGSLLNQQENTRTIEHLREKIQELEDCATNGTC